MGGKDDDEEEEENGVDGVVGVVGVDGVDGVDGEEDVSEDDFKMSDSSLAIVPCNEIDCCSTNASYCFCNIAINSSDIGSCIVKQCPYNLSPDEAVVTNAK